MNALGKPYDDSSDQPLPGMPLPCACCGRFVAPLDADQRCGHCGANRAVTHPDERRCALS